MEELGLEWKAWQIVIRDLDRGVISTLFMVGTSERPSGPSVLGFFLNCTFEGARSWLLALIKPEGLALINTSHAHLERLLSA